MKKTDKELADELDARDRLRARGYEQKSCVMCKGVGGRDDCPCCGGKGYTWEGPMMSRHVPLEELSEHLREVRLSQPKVTLRQAQEQANRLREAMLKARRWGGAEQ